jgi:photosystem II stability/assembly factor-like uncharacterized protein
VNVRATVIAVALGATACSSAAPSPEPTNAPRTAVVAPTTSSTASPRSTTTAPEPIEHPSFGEIPPIPDAANALSPTAWESRSNDDCGIDVFHNGEYVANGSNGCSTLWIPNQLHTVDDDHAWIFGRSVENPTLRRTTDGGRTWEWIETNLASVRFFDRHRGIGFRPPRSAFCSDTITITRDGGRTWADGTRLTAPSLGRGQACVRFDFTHGDELWVTGEYNRADGTSSVPVGYWSDDEGESWHLPSAYTTAASLEADQLIIATEQLWYAETHDGGRSTVLRSADDGETWDETDLAVSRGHINFEHAAGDEVWANLSEQGDLRYHLYSADRGHTWIAAEPEAPRRDTEEAIAVPAGAMTSMVFVDDEHGFGIPSWNWEHHWDALIAATDDGGVTWTTTGSLPPGVSNLAFSRPTLGFAYGRGLFRSATRFTDWRGVIGRSRRVTQVSSVGQSTWVVVEGCERCTSTLSELAPDGVRTPRPLPDGARRVRVSRIDEDVAYITYASPTGDRSRPWRPAAAMTTDGGRHWATRAGCPIAYTFDVGSLGTIAVSPSGDLWLLCTGESASGNQPKAVFRSDDTGRSWHLAAANVWLDVGDMTTFGYATDLAVTSDHTAYVFLVNTGLLRTDDGGSSWRIVLECGVPPCGFGHLGPRVWFASGFGDPAYGLWTAAGDAPLERIPG